MAELNVTLPYNLEAEQSVLGSILIDNKCMADANLYLRADYFYLPRLSVEFEYLYVNGELDIDRIFSQSRRKRAASYELSNMEIMAPFSSHRL